MRRLVFSLAAVLFFLAGCGGSIKAPSELRYSVATAKYMKGVAIAANSPSSAGGAVSSYSVSPALPAGLSMSGSTGVVSGTPSAITGTGGYTVTAYNKTGSTSAALIITVNDQPPTALSYTPGTAIYPQGLAVAPNTPSNSGGAPTSYSVSPALPAGLNLSASSGIISGTPTAITAAASYTVTASDDSGSTTVALNITVAAPPPMAQAIPNLGLQITPTAPYNSTFQPLVPGLTEYPDYQAGQAVSTVVSPDGNTLLILTSGYNRLFNPRDSPNGGFNIDQTAYDYANSTEWVFVFDISKGTPVQTQAVAIPNAFHGIVFDPHRNTAGKNDTFYVSGGMGDYPFINGIATPLALGVGFTGPGDNVHVFGLSAAGSWQQQSQLIMDHPAGLGLDIKPPAAGVAVNSQVAVQPMAAGVAVSSDGQTLVVANYYNDSLTMFSGGVGNWTRIAPDVDLRPGDGTSTTMGTAGGEYPFWVAIQGSGQNAIAYVSSVRDREIDVVSLGATRQVVGRVPVKGEPLKMAMNKAQSRLYVAEDMSDTVDVIDISKGGATNGAAAILESIPVRAPASVMQSYPLVRQYRGANTNSVTLSPDETQLYVTDGNLNAVAVVPLSGTDSGDQATGLIPTGWYPNSVAFGPKVNSSNGNWVYVVNGKSPTGPDTGLCYSAAPPLDSGLPGAHKNCYPSQEYNPQRVKAGFQSFPQPTAAQLGTLTAQVAINNHFSATESSSDAATMAAVRNGIQHVIFIIKENRGYDQVLGDLEVGNGDPSLNEFGEAITPNLHNLARTFVTLDNILASSEVSFDGWPYTTSARAPDVVEHTFTIQYAGRGLSYETEGFNRNINEAIPTLAGRQAEDPLTPADGNILPGTANVAAPDGPDDVLDRGKGYLWDAAYRAGLSMRDYGFFIDSSLYACATPAACIQPTLTDPFSSKTQVAYSASPTLAPFTDPYYRGFDNAFPDYYRFKEWEREFDTNYATGGLPNLSLVRFMHDHTGNFNDPGGFKINTPELQQSDNDYAVGLLVQKIANTVYANNTLIFIIEDDSQDSGDHVDSHRTVAFVAGAYVKQQALVSTPYNTINFLRTIEEVLGLGPMNLNDALARPMADIFNTTPSAWSFTPTVPAGLYATNLPITKPPNVRVPSSRHNWEYWERATKDMDFRDADRMDFALYNRILWKGLMGNRPYPATPTGLDLRHNRKKLLADYRRSLKPAVVQAATTLRN